MQLPEILRVVCEQEPAKPSEAVTRVEQTPDGGRTALTPELVSSVRDGQPEKLRRSLTGDLDNIVLMALRKEPRRRYASVEQFAEDIRRHLDGLPVIARKATLGYRAEKFVKRHKAGVAAAALALVTLLAGIATTFWQARVARAERAKAERRFNDVRGLATSFLFDLHKEIETLPGSTKARQTLVNKALETYDKLALEAAGDQSLQSDLAKSYATVSDIQWNRYYANLGDLAGAMESARKALEIRQPLVAANPSNEQARQNVAHSHLQIGDLLIATGKTNEALESYRQSLRNREEIAATGSKSARDRHSLMISYQRVGDTLGNPGFPNVGDKAGALESYLKMLKIQEELAAEEPSNPDRQRSLRIGYEKIRDIRWALGERERAFEIYQQALEINERLVANYPDNVRYRRDLGIVYGKMGDMRAQMGDTAAALARYRQALEIQQELATLDPNDANAQRDLLFIRDAIVKLLFKTGNKAAAAEHRR